tara:strand:- start:1758 stop:2378 length:621 start_codon:yes stop_codon:yes gene_type:complete
MNIDLDSMGSLEDLKSLLGQLSGLLPVLQAKIEHLEARSGKTAEGVAWEIREIAEIPGIHPETSIERLTRADLADMTVALAELPAEKQVAEGPTVAPFELSELPELLRVWQLRGQGTLRLEAGPSIKLARKIKAWKLNTTPTPEAILAAVPKGVHTARLRWQPYHAGSALQISLMLVSRGESVVQTRTIHWGKLPQMWPELFSNGS